MPIKVCIIDDDPVFVFLIRKTIQKTGFESETIVFGDGERALKYLKENSENEDALPGLILLDLNMPIMDGWEFLDEFIVIEPQLAKKIPLYLVSSSISPHDIERSKNYSVVSDFLIKPLDKERLVELFKNLEPNQ